MTTSNWEFTPATAQHPAAYNHNVHSMLVIQRGPRAWDAYHLAYGSIVENVFSEPKDALAWCEGRAM